VVRLLLAASFVIGLAGEASAQGPIKIGFQAAEHRHPHVPARESVLEVQSRRVSEAAGLFVRLPAVPPLLMR
jgi:hypothetical protein